MKKYTTKIVIGLISLGFLSSYVISTYKGYKNQNQSITVKDIPFTKEGNLQILDSTETILKNLEIEIANTDYETQTGLMYRSTMKENRGMLFVFNKEAMHSFYMRNTKIPLDIIYINKDFEIVSAAKNTIPFDKTSLPSEYPVMYVLEINGGKMDEWNISIGDKIAFTKD
ncbi:hypothetical protein NBRC110019_25740 [Neptunitalea chrysea]|uniref:DUF192 domain-containing protein n=1 Tax=Neptunitalea chrysea TaxID=1647581 RepID=A0A9W6B998_9FLAO|nr:DUF192 domain-containing protein [Neptunitalea chrysea]GLB53533.1 hypothetical protein NBRC110019_25740 [Neptunitalea chrysea]